MPIPVPMQNVAFMNASGQQVDSLSSKFASVLKTLSLFNVFTVSLNFQVRNILEWQVSPQFMSQGSMPLDMGDVSLHDMVKKQLEYYLSEENLMKDGWLKEQMEPEA